MFAKNYFPPSYFAPTYFAPVITVEVTVDLGIDEVIKQDLQLKRNAQGLYDFQITNKDFSAVPGFETAILVSLFTDSRAPRENVKTSLRRRGWIGNMITADINRSLGSLLWLYDQSRITESILNQLKNDAQQSLSWMIEDGVARNVTATVTSELKHGIVVNVDIETVEGNNQRYAVLWRRTSNANNI